MIAGGCHVDPQIMLDLKYKKPQHTNAAYTEAINTLFEGFKDLKLEIKLDDLLAFYKDEELLNTLQGVRIIAEEGVKINKMDFFGLLELAALNLTPEEIAGSYLHNPANLQQHPFKPSIDYAVSGKPFVLKPSKDPKSPFFNRKSLKPQKTL
jgi:hypothetical protein